MSETTAVRGFPTALGAGTRPKDEPETDWMGNALPRETARVEPRRSARVTWASEIRMEIAKMLDTHVPLGELSIAAGREGTGKSSKAIRLAAGCTRGTLSGDLRGQPRRVLYVAKEDSWSTTIAPRLQAAGADLSMVGRVDFLLDGDTRRAGALSLPEDTPMLEGLIREHEIALIVFDPIVSTMGSSKDGNKVKDVRETFEPLVEVAHALGCTIHGIAHFNKGQSDPISMISGSHALKDLARSVVVFATDSTTPDGERIYQQVKNSLGPIDPAAHRYRIDSATVVTDDGPTDVAFFRETGEISDRSVAEMLATNTRPADDDGDEVVEWLRTELESRPGCEAAANAMLKAGHAAGFSDDQVKRAKKKIPGFNVRSIKGSTGWAWVLEPKS